MDPVPPSRAPAQPLTRREIARQCNANHDNCKRIWPIIKEALIQIGACFAAGLTVLAFDINPATLGIAAVVIVSGIAFVIVRSIKKYMHQKHTDEKIRNQMERCDFLPRQDSSAALADRILNSGAPREANTEPAFLTPHVLAHFSKNLKRVMNSELTVDEDTSALIDQFVESLPPGAKITEDEYKDKVTKFLDSIIKRANFDKQTKILSSVFDSGLKKKAAHVEKGLSVVAKLDKFLKAFALAEKLVSKLSDIQPEFLADVGSIASKSKAGLDLLSISLECVRYALRAEEITQLKNNKKILRYSLQKATTKREQMVLIKEIKKIDQKIAKLEAANNKHIASLSFSILSSLFSGTEDIITFVQEFSGGALSAEALANLDSIKAGVGLVGGVISLCSNLLKTILTGKKMVSYDQQIKDYQKRIKELEPDDHLLGYILRAKVDCLRRSHDESKFSFAMKIAKTTKTTVSIAASIQAILITAGVVVSATTAAAFTGMGIGALVLVALVLILEVSYMIYVHRHEIACFFQKMYYKFRDWIISCKLKGELKALKVAQVHMEKAAKKKGKLEKNHDFFEKTGAKMDATWIKHHDERISKCMAQITQCNFKINQIKLRATNLKRESEGLQGRIKVAEETMKLGILQEKFRNYTPTDVKILTRVIEDRLANPEERQKIISFLESEKFDISSDGIKLDDVLSYITA